MLSVCSYLVVCLHKVVSNASVDVVLHAAAVVDVFADIG